MPRAFCVMVLQDKVNVKTGTSSLKYDNFRVLVGPQENIDKLLTWMDEHVKGDFKVQKRTQAM